MCIRDRDDGASLALAATGRRTPKLCMSTMDKDDIMKKTKRKNMISIMGMIMIEGFSKSRN